MPLVAVPAVGVNVPEGMTVVDGRVAPDGWLILLVLFVDDEEVDEELDDASPSPLVELILHQEFTINKKISLCQFNIK